MTPEELAALKAEYVKSLEHIEQYEWWRLDSLTDAAEAYIAALEGERDAAVAVIKEVDGLRVLSSTVQFMEQAQEITGRYLYPEVYQQKGGDDGQAE